MFRQTTPEGSGIKITPFEFYLMVKVENSEIESAVLWGARVTYRSCRSRAIKGEALLIHYEHHPVAIATPAPHQIASLMCCHLLVNGFHSGDS